MSPSEASPGLAGSGISDRRWCLRARQVFLAPGRLLDDGAVWGRGNVIEGVGAWTDARAAGAYPPQVPALDAGDALVLPALLNAHAHLELGFLRGRIPPGLPFASWLLQMLEQTRNEPQETYLDSIVKGCKELEIGGCAYVADIVRRLVPGQAPPHPAAPLHYRFYWEMIDLDESRAVETVRATVERALASQRPGSQPGLSPHAPYTTSLALIREAVRASARHRLPLCIHCDETEDEHRFCLHGDGPLRDFLDTLGALPENWQVPGCTPVQWLDHAGALGPPNSQHPPVLLVHLNAIEDRDLDILARRRCAAVVCPGSHTYFQRGAFPLARLLRAGVTTALGTDGLCSNDRLSMWDEIRRALQLIPELTAEQGIALATSEAARALGIDSFQGRIAPGCRAAFAIVDSPDPAPPLDRPGARDWLLAPTSRVQNAVIFS